MAARTADIRRTSYDNNVSYKKGIHHPKINGIGGKLNLYLTTKETDTYSVSIFG